MSQPGGGCSCLVIVVLVILAVIAGGLANVRSSPGPAPASVTRTAP